MLAIGGWADSYTNAVPRLLANLQVPRLGMIGPWGHIYPQGGVPGPAIGFLREAMRWSDHWLKDEDRGIMEEPMLRAWLSDAYPPSGKRTETPGRGDGEPALPSPQSHGRAGGEGMGTAYWPLIWPAPYPAALTIDTGASQLLLPVRNRDDDASPTFLAPASARVTPTTQLDPGSVRRWSTQDHVTGETTYVTEGVGGLFGEGVLRFDEIGTELSHTLRRELTIRDDDPLSARYVLTQSYEMGREGWRTRSETRCELTSDRETFHLTGEHVAFENGVEMHRRVWDERIARDHL